MSSDPKPTEAKLIAPRLDHEEASQKSGQTSTNVKVAQQIVNQAKDQSKGDKK